MIPKSNDYLDSKLVLSVYLILHASLIFSMNKVKGNLQTIVLGTVLRAPTLVLKFSTHRCQPHAWPC